jgi:hypothetical protein
VVKRWVARRPWWLVLLLGGAAIAGAESPHWLAHPIHTTLTQVELDQTTGALVVTVRVFADDLGTVVGRFAKIAPGQGPAHEVPDAAVAAYVAAKLSLVNGQSSVPLRWSGAKRTGDVVWITLSAPRGAVRATKGLGVRNAMLFELYADQINIVQSGARSLLFVRTDGFKSLWATGDD